VHVDSFRRSKGVRNTFGWYSTLGNRRFHQEAVHRKQSLFGWHRIFPTDIETHIQIISSDNRIRPFLGVEFGIGREILRLLPLGMRIRKRSKGLVLVERQ